MTGHLVEVWPDSVRRLCCGTKGLADTEAERAAFESIDDPYALVEGRPVAVAELWRSLLAAIDCGTSDAVTVVHPSWWSPRRVAVVDDAARTLHGQVQIRPRSWLSSRMTGSPRNHAVVEIADTFVVITAAGVTVVARDGATDDDADAVTGRIRAMTPAVDTVVVDTPPAVPGAAVLATAISKRLRTTCGVSVTIAHESYWRSHVAQHDSPRHANSSRGSARSSPRRGWIAAILTVGVLLGVAAWRHPAQPRPRESTPTTYLVEGRIALEVPARWPVRRIVAGPGSARLQVTSPIDPEVAVHATQSRVALPGLNATADFLKGAIDAAPRGVFVDFDPAGRVAGHPAVTYREIRSDHDIQWTVWVDKAVRISIGCQSRSGRADLVGQACELAVRSARALD